MLCSAYPGSRFQVVLARLADCSGVVGFCGSRHGARSGRVQLLSALAACARARVLVGDARGVDATVHQFCPTAEVFTVEGSGRGAFAERSIRFVRALVESGGFLVSFPGQPCPVQLSPSPLSVECFCGLGSGSWASLAFARGLGVSCFVWVPDSRWVPGWGFSSLGGGWWVA
jgi:hypothetical protein